MSATGRENGLRQDWFIDERSDPEKATVAAAKYLSTLADMFDGDWHLALASYNGGPGRMQRAIKKGHSNDFWKLADTPRLLPRETRDYVPMILAAIIIARNPAQYGFDFDAEPVLDYETVQLSTPVDLRHIAEWADATVSVIQALNPELRRWTTPIQDGAYPLKVPSGTADAVRAELAVASGSDLASLNWYTVRRGETLSRIAKKLRVSRTDLAGANGLRTNARLRIGQKLVIPREATVLMASRSNRPAPDEDRVVRASDDPDGARVKVSYRVKRGDTLASIARNFSTNISSIKSWNRLASSKILAGERLTIYTARAN
jgi:membrane-bound lytic murein transglycosylase D